ncbi:MAG: FecR domain-containing protein [Deltaproteobacteria bacterium]|nr:FecR domain-containing protein [Deltaproteobacteria bacterium]
MNVARTADLLRQNVPAWTAADLARMQAGTRRTIRRQKIARAGGTAAAAACAVLVLVLIQSRPQVEPAPLPLLVAVAPPALTFADGTRVDASEKNAVKVIASSDAAVEVQTTAAHARFDVAPHRTRRFVVRCDGARIEVLGTIFSVDRTSAGVLVTVEEGKVRVVDASGTASTLVDGQSYLSPPATAASGARTENAPGPFSPVSRPAPAKRARQAAPGLDDAEHALAAGDDARAIAILQPLAKERSTNGAVAAFMLGKIHARAGEVTRALAAFERAETLAPKGPLAEDALHRQVVCLRALGRDKDADARQQRYRDAFPAGAFR